MNLASYAAPVTSPYGNGKSSVAGDVAMTSPLAVIILAAGKGTRMKSDLHKVLHPIAGRPMLIHLIDSLNQAGATRRVVVVGASGEQVEAAVAATGVEIAWQREQLGTAHAALQAKAALADFDGVATVYVAFDMTRRAS
jgi:bifunctional UDP-N-acetylglucosamine pyrophosphorylase/glucosamine-1-phosphate N-acetyltransferase